MDNLTPAMRQYWEIKNQYPDSILFFRMGDFYEMFFDDAVAASRILEITLTSRGKSKGEDIPLCGVPYHSSDSYLAKLIRHGLKVAICEQVEDPKTAKGVVKREVVRVVTPGTALDSQMLDAKTNSFLLAINRIADTFGLAALDLTTGEFIVTEMPDEQTLRDEIIRLSPREILMPQGFSDVKRIVGAVMGDISVNYLPPDRFDGNEWETRLAAEIGTLDKQGMAGMNCAAGAALAVLQYVRETQKVESLPVSSIRAYRTVDFLFMDESTSRNLELTSNIRDGGKKGSLLWLLDMTVTPMGGRRLKNWVDYPLISVEKINERLDAVEELKNEQPVRERIKALLASVYDIERLNSRISLGSANAKDMTALRASISSIPGIRRELNGAGSSLLKRLADGMDELGDVLALISSTIVDDPPFSLREGGFIRDGVNPELDDLRAISRDGKSYIAAIESRERARTGINSLKIRYNKVFGYYIEVTQANLPMIPPDYIRKQTLVNAERFITPELKDYETKVLSSEERIRGIEYHLFQELREKIARESARIQRTSFNISVLDAIVSLAETAELRNYTRPVVSDSERLDITGGRHPVVEQFLMTSERFVPNDTSFDPDKGIIAIITGPNMAGKSTYIRQVALIAIMAHIGSFVPAESAVIGVMDRIFSRVGAADNLSKGQSTFMVEMIETSNILRNATSKSLIVLDEIGRGTSTYDGLSIAWAVAEYLSDRIRAKTLFATHYHELTDLALMRGNIRNLNVAVREWNDQVIFLRKIVEGGADRSYGIHVAKLAGLPEDVIARGMEILTNLEKGEFSVEGLPKLASTHKENGRKSREIQLPLFKEKDDLREALRSLEIEKMTPLQAIVKLEELKKMV